MTSLQREIPWQAHAQYEIFIKSIKLSIKLFYRRITSSFKCIKVQIMSGELDTENQVEKTRRSHSITDF